MDCAGHGTHVSGIISANALNGSSPLPFAGVAPGITIRAYKVFGCEGTTSSDAIANALAMAVSDKVNIISVSISGPSGWSEDGDAVLMSRIAEKGIFVSVAAGNSGQEGTFYGGAPASGLNVASVASVDSTHLVAFSVKTKDGSQIVSPREDRGG
jgi:hypothetical protein